MLNNNEGNLLEDRKILKELAIHYREIANSDRNKMNIILHKSVNNLNQKRPVVLIDEIPWHEMNIDGELTIRCTNTYLQTIEWFFRSNIYKHTHMPADMILPGYVPVNKVVHSSGIGIDVEEETLATDENNNIISHQYNDILKDEEDLDKIQNPVLTYDKDETMKRYQLVGEILGDILPVKLRGIPYFSFGPWDDIARYRNVTNLLIDLKERPDFMHKIVRRLVETGMSYLEQYEEIGLLDDDAYNLHCTPGYTDDMPKPKPFKTDLTRENIWGRGFAQIFAHVSRDMHREFDIEYMKKTVGQCGLVYYGCCEPLDKKIDIVEEIPNLRKISITPWANVEVAAEAINTKYVLSAKPNPALVAENILNEDNLKKELGTILNACKKNNCSCDIVLKDISTCNNRPKNIFTWEKIAMDLVENY